jgi:hypothetical protein
VFRSISSTWLRRATGIELALAVKRRKQALNKLKKNILILARVKEIQQ